jgi:tRNA threonylcarbamoyladenosine biosynthesis protein TsaB
MRIVAIETSGRWGSLALLRGEGDDAVLVCQANLTGDANTAQWLATALRDLFSRAGWEPRSVDLVAVAIGPGSFTGLRIGVTTAKTFAYAVRAEIVGVNTLAVLARQSDKVNGPLWAIMDAQRQELFVSRFESRGDELDMTGDTRIVPQETFLAGLQPGDHVTGPALVRLAPRLPSGVAITPQEFWQPTAIAVGQLAWRIHRSGRRDDVWKLAPAYYRASAAEEKAARQTTPTEF